jgi:hypothetical protein
VSWSFSPLPQPNSFQHFRYGNDHAAVTAQPGIGSGVDSFELVKAPIAPINMPVSGIFAVFFLHDRPGLLLR